MENSTKKFKLSIFGFTDYRIYLKDYYQFRKESERGYSYRAFSKAAGFTSPNFLKLVIEGERNVSAQAIPQFCKALHLEGASAEYFTALVRMNQAKNDEEKDQCFAILQKLTPHHKRRDLHSEGHRYLSHWLYPTLREMILLNDFQEDPYWISRRLLGSASPSEVSGALSFLLQEGFVRRDEKTGKLELEDNMVFSSDEVRSLAIRNYHRQMLECAKNALEKLPMEQREFGAITFVLPESSLEELKYRLKKFRDDLHNWAIQAASGGKGDSVVQLNIQMFPQAKRTAQ